MLGPSKAKGKMGKTCGWEDDKKSARLRLRVNNQRHYLTYGPNLVHTYLSMQLSKFCGWYRQVGVGVGVGVGMGLGTSVA